MKAELVYKCQRCGDIIPQGTINSADEFHAADMTILHECSVIYSDGRLEDDDTPKFLVAKIGLAKLVGYDEYPG